MSAIAGAASPSPSSLPVTGPRPSSKPSQIKFVRPLQMSLFSRVTCHPPLGQITCPRRGRNDTLRFTVVIESNTAFPKQEWEAQIWHNISSAEWTALPLTRCSSSVAPLVSVNQDAYNSFRHVFSGDLPQPTGGGTAQFTVRFRTNPDVDWQWVNELHHTSDGELVFSPKDLSFDRALLEGQRMTRAGEDLTEYFDRFSQDVHVEKRASEAPGSLLWNISGETNAAAGGESGVTSMALGIPSSLVRYFALVRIWTPWLGPRHGRGHFRLTEDAILCSFLRSDGVNLVLLAVSGVDNILTVFNSGDNGEVIIKAQNDNADKSRFQVLASAAQSFEIALGALVYEARKIVKPFSEENVSQRVPTPVSPLGDDVVIVEKDPEAQWLAEWYDGLTYCTWNAIGQNVTEEKLFNALDILKSQGIHISNLIIDDNWQSLDNEGQSQFQRGWKQFEGNPAAFPKGFKNTIQTIRRSHPNIDHISVWHAILGYWGGISPDGDLAKKYKTKRVGVKHPMAGGPIASAFETGTLLTIDPDDVQRFYNDFYGFLVSIGVDSVKADAQFFLDLLKDPKDRRIYINAYQDAWTIASLRHFSTRAISCMSMHPQAIFHSQLPTNKPTIPLRNSDDFFPGVAASHPWHVFCNAHNALLTRYLNVVPDWDMFQTSHPYASFHAAARCVSGGPIYITDEPGKHNVPLINEMTAPTTQGNTVILRPGLTGRTIDVYNDYNERHILRVGTYTGWARTGSGCLGLFNIADADACCIVPLLDFPGIPEDSPDSYYIIRAHTTGIITQAMQATDPSSLVSVELKPRCAEILTAYPVHSFELKKSQGRRTDVAALGLLGKMTGVAAVRSSDFQVESNGRLRMQISLKMLGTLGVYISDLKHWDIDQHFMVLIRGDPVPRSTVYAQRDDEARVLGVDVLEAWRQMRLEPGWSNEVTVEIFVG